SPYPSAKALIEDARVAVADAVIDRLAPGGVRTRAQFERVRDDFSAAGGDELFQTALLAARVLTAAREVGRAVRAQNSMPQLAGLIHPGFISATGTTRLAHFPRYLRGALDRVSSLADNPGRDRQRMTEYERAASLYEEAGGEIPPAQGASEALVHVRWLLEE